MRRAIATLVALGLLVGAMALPASGQSNTIADIVIGASSTDGVDDNPQDYDILLAAALADETILAAVSGTGAFEGVDITVMAPKDKAFLRLTGAATEADAVQWLVDNGLAPGSAALQAVVLYHVYVGVATVEDVFFADYDSINALTMADGNKLRARWVQLIDGVGNRVKPALRATNIQADNGIVHTITEVLLPPAG